MINLSTFGIILFSFFFGVIIFYQVSTFKVSQKKKKFQLSIFGILVSKYIYIYIYIGILAY